MPPAAITKAGSPLSAMRAKGIAEFGLCGVAAAVANAIYNATGIKSSDIRSRPPADQALRRSASLGAR
ncbi:hypothetical protein EHS39_28670 [Ensifer sp. MPMI2T]|nr:hypothetical protein EHS39_28670 [Ensifer sp. MPMI2T]